MILRLFVFRPFSFVVLFKLVLACMVTSIFHCPFASLTQYELYSKPSSLHTHICLDWFWGLTLKPTLIGLMCDSFLGCDHPGHGNCLVILNILLLLTEFLRFFYLKLIIYFLRQGYGFQFFKMNFLNNKWQNI